MRLGHVAVSATDPEGLAGFYATFLGLERIAQVETEETGRMVLLATQHGHAPDVQLVSRPEARHVAFRVDTLAELRERHAAAAEHGVRVLFAFDHGATLSFYVRDPEGNPLELYWETGRPPSNANRPVDLTRPESEILQRLGA